VIGDPALGIVKASVPSHLAAQLVEAMRIRHANATFGTLANITIARKILYISVGAEAAVLRAIAAAESDGLGGRY
jgi:hypothetical protein